MLIDHLLRDPPELAPSRLSARQPMIVDMLNEVVKHYEYLNTCRQACITEEEVFTWLSELLDVLSESEACRCVM